MIVLHRLGHTTEPFHLNPDLILTIEANPDTVVTLATGSKVVVAEPPERVATLISEYRVEILGGALRRRRETRQGFASPRIAQPRHGGESRAENGPASPAAAPLGLAAEAVLSALADKPDARGSAA